MAQESSVMFVDRRIAELEAEIVRLRGLKTVLEPVVYPDEILNADALIRQIHVISRIYARHYPTRGEPMSDFTVSMVTWLYSRRVAPSFRAFGIEPQGVNWAVGFVSVSSNLVVLHEREKQISQPAGPDGPAAVPDEEVHGSPALPDSGGGIAG